ncbi:MAG: dacB, partial [Phycisphaerales bacterium]|nr:dacB [Phycisphaerales bacterium]
QGRAWDLEHGRDEPGNWRAGGEAERAFLKRLGVDDAKFVPVDGSGLSSDDRVTARLVSDLLLKMTKHEHASVFRASLSVSGTDGTLDDRLTDLTGLVQGKSGTIDGVKALSGYLTTRGGELLVFSMIFNDAPPKVERRCAGLLDNACRVLVEWPAVERAKVNGAGGGATRP